MNIHTESQQGLTTGWMLTDKAESRKRNISEVSKLSSWQMVILLREKGDRSGRTCSGEETGEGELYCGQVDLEVTKKGLEQVSHLQITALEVCRYEA